MNSLVSFLYRHPVLTGFLMVVLAVCTAVLQRPFGLHNDDMQIYFLLLNGGVAEGTLGYGLYTNHALGSCMAFFSYMWPSVNVYLVFLLFLSIVACCSANFYVLSTQNKEKDQDDGYSKLHRLVTLCLLFIINVMCMRTLQYTQVAVWAAVCGVLLLCSVEKSGSWWVLRSLFATLLLIGAFCLRESALVPAAFVAMAAVCAKKFQNKRALGAIGCVAVLLGALHVYNELAYQASPEWQDARRYLSLRVKILDSKDNSGLDKGAQLEAIGVSPRSFDMYKSFIYTPSLGDTERVKQCLSIHREGRKGLFGCKWLADAGFLARSPHDKQGDTTLLMKLTAWVPLLLATILFLPATQKRTLSAACVMLLAVIAYVGILIAFQRAVGRVVNPVLYVAAVWVLALPLGKTRINESKLCHLCTLGVSVVCILFVTRHWHFWERSDPAAYYCAAHPDTLYLTTCQQGLGLYPRGLDGYSASWLKKSNILPIADGWSFYSPAYKAALRARGFESLQDAMLHANTLIVIRQSDKEWVLQKLPELAHCEWGKKIELSIVDTYGEFYFAKVIQK